MMKWTIAYTITSVLLLFTIFPVAAQGVRSFSNNATHILSAQGKFHTLFKLSAIMLGIRKGGAISLGYGMWSEHPTFQYSLNTAVQWRVRGFLGNYHDGANPKDSRSKSQLVFMFSPMLTVNLSKQDYIYQELEPFYLGTANAVFSKYRYAVTLGSSFTVSPRGTYKNVTTARNRAQQDFMFSVNLKNFNFTMYDDYFYGFTDFLQLGDNWDRFFTGGGFMRYRFNDEFTMHVYSEVYTGINRANPFLRPDVISYKYKGSKWRRQNYANQDPGQEYFNSSWLVIKGTYTSSQVPGAGAGVYMPSYNFMMGFSGPWTMFSQNFIHNIIRYDKKNQLQLHHFLHRSNVPGNLETGGPNALVSAIKGMFFGGGIQTNIEMR